MALAHGVQQPKHWVTPGKLPTDPGLFGVSAYSTVRGHWHYVSFGLSELWTKETDDPEVSGFGYEFTMRVKRTQGDEPATWVLTLLHHLADVTFAGSDFRPGQTLDAGGPITGEPSSALRGVLFAADPELHAIRTPFGRLEFMQVVGITSAELRAIKADRDGTIAAIQAGNRFLVTDPSR